MSQVSGGETAWTEICVVAEPGLQDALLLGELAPLLRAEAGRVPQAFFLRERVGSTCRLRVWLKAMGEEVDALTGALRAAAQRGEVSPEVTVLPGASLEAVGGPYGGTQAMGLLAGMLADANSLLIGQLAEVAAGRAQRTSIALDIMVAHLPAVDFLHVHPDRYVCDTPVRDFPLTFPVYRSHADGFFIMSTSPVAARAQLDEQYERAREPIRRRVAAVLSQLSGGPLVSPVAARWCELARAWLHRAEEVVRSGALVIGWDEGYLGDRHDLTISPFHQVAQELPVFRAALQADLGYQAMRITMSALYLALGSLGLRLVERYFLCHAISRACEELFAVQSTAVLHELSQILAVARLPRVESLTAT